MLATESEIVQYVREHDGATPESLSEHLGVTTRTLRTYIHKLNDALSGSALVELQKGVYTLVVTDETRLAELLKGLETTPVDLNDPRERVACLLNDLLMRSDWVTLEELSHELHVSRSTISGDLKLVRQQIAHFDLDVETRARYGLRVTGSELNRRICLASNAVDSYARLFERAASAGNVTGGPAANTAIRNCGPETIEDIARCVDEALSESDFSISALAFQNLLVHLGIALIRIGDGNYVPFPYEELERLADSREMATARVLAGNIERTFDVELPEQEIAYIAIHLASKQAIERAAYVMGSPEATPGTAAGKAENTSSGQTISDDVWRIVDGMVERVWQTFRFDFRNDLELRMNLACHVAPLAVRLRYHMSLTNPMLTEIRTRYPLAYSMAVEAASVLADACDAALSPDEIGYIAMTFGLALERSKTAPSKKRILVVCASGVGSAQMLEHLYREQFADCVESVEACDVARIDRVDFSHIDYVFTTVPISAPLPVPVREVGFFPTGSEVTRIRELLTNKVGSATAPFSEIAARFSPELFFVYPACNDKDDLLDMMCAEMGEFATVAPEFRKLVSEREATAPTAFGNKIAIPHPMHAVTEQAFCSVAVLREPIDWAGHEVRLAVLIALAKEDPHRLKRMFTRISEIVLDEPAIDRFLANPTWDAWLGLLAGDAGPDPEPKRASAG